MPTPTPPAPPQSYSNHRRFHVLLHVVIIPLLMVNLIVLGVAAARHPGFLSTLAAVTALVLVLLAAVMRWMVLRVQDRLIRLEMRLRLDRVLPPEKRAAALALSPGQLVALRFAGDGELPGLVTRTLAGEYPSNDAIKRAITDWQADHLRV